MLHQQDKAHEKYFQIFWKYTNKHHLLSKALLDYPSHNSKTKCLPRTDINKSTCQML